ncbi:MAG: hypothetical protein KDI33_20475 [Halioglobus sp.]|nr:hypothetical protein [Halioglobus sp.]
MNTNFGPARQQGMVMIIAMIMLLTVTLMIVSGSNVVQANLKVVQNMESLEQTRSAALATLEEAKSSDQFTVSPGNMFAESCEVDNQRCYDTNGDGVTDITVVVEPARCVIVSPKKNSELRPFEYPSEASCFLADTLYSMCAESVWEIVAVATDVATGAQVSVRQGVSIETTLNKVDTACPL